MKRFLATLALAVTALGIVPTLASAETPSPTVMLDQYPLEFDDVSPMIVEGRTMVPYRAIAESLGLSVHYNGDTQTITASTDQRIVVMRVNHPIATVNGREVQLEVPPFVQNGRTLVPLRFISEAFDAAVQWDQNAYQVQITSPIRLLRGFTFYKLPSYEKRDWVPRFHDAAYGWAWLDDNGQVDMESHSEYRWPIPAGDDTGDSLLEDAREAGVRRHLMIFKTDQTLALTALALDESRHQATASSIVTTVLEKGFDGALLDWEGLGLTETGEDLDRLRAGFVHLIATISAALHAEGKELTLSVHPPNGAYEGYDYAALAPHVDLFQLMAHNYNEAEGPEPPERVHEAIQLMLAAAPREKVLLGVVTGFENETTLPRLVGLAKRFQLAGVSVWYLGSTDPTELDAIESSVRLRP